MNRSNVVRHVVSRVPAFVLSVVTLSAALPDRAAAVGLPLSAEARQAAIRKVATARVPFVENRGQIVDERVAFYAQTFGGTVSVTKDGELLYCLPKVAGRSGEGQGARGASREAAIERPTIASGLVLRERLLKSEPLTAKGAVPAQAVVSYFLGNDPSQWQAGVGTWDTVGLGEAY